MIAANFAQGRDAGLTAAIDPKMVANTVASARRQESPELAEKFHKEPRLVELLWFLQSQSTKPGGLRAVARRVVKLCRDLLGNAEIAELQRSANRAERRERLIKALKELPHAARYHAFGEEGMISELFTAECDPDALEVNGVLIPDFLEDSAEDQAETSKNGQAPLSRQLQGALDIVSTDRLLDQCAEEAERELPSYMTRLCIEACSTLWDYDFWYMRRPVDGLLRLMDAHASAELARLAETSVKRLVLDGLDYAWSAREPVWIHGDPRHGKTACLQAFAAAHPGRARWVPVPYSDSDNDLFRSVAKALGIAYGAGAPAWQLREEISWVLDNSDLMLIFDEAAFLYPSNPGRKPSASRLEWVRTEVVDRGLPCILCTTPQGHAYAERKFRKATSYPMEQWLGRWIYRVELPELLTEEDLLAVARLHFPAIGAAGLRELAARALAHDGQLKAIEAVGKRSAYLAGKNGRAAASAEDVRRALEEMLPSALSKPIAEPQKAPCTVPAEPRFTRRPDGVKKVGKISSPSLVPA